MAENFDHARPIYLQLVQRIQWQIVRGELKAGDKIPSVRETALKAGVNPNTVQRAYMELENRGIASTKRGQGKFITEDEATLVELRKTLKDEQIERFVREMTEMGFTADEMLDGLHRYLQEGGKSE